MLTGILEFWYELFHEVIHDSAEADDSTHIHVVVEWEDDLHQLSQYPECLALGIAIDEEVCYDVVESLAVEKTRVSNGVGTEDIAQLCMHVTLLAESPVDVFLNCNEVV